MLDEMLLAGELQEPSKKVFYTCCFPFCACFLPLRNQSMQLHHLCSVHACLSRTYPAHHELEIVLILIVSVIIIIIMLALDSTAVPFCMFALCDLSSQSMSKR